MTLIGFNTLGPELRCFGVTYEKPYFVPRLRDDPLPKQEYHEGVRIVRFRSRAQLFTYYWSPEMLSWLNRYAKDFDVIHTHVFRFSNNEFTALCHLRNKIPYIITAHDEIKLDRSRGTAVSIADAIYRRSIGALIFRLSSKVIAFDESYAESYRKYLGVPPGKIVVIPNGIDYEQYQNLPKAEDLRLQLGAPDHVVLYLGRFIAYKNPDKLILAFKHVLARYPNSKLLMVGKDNGLMDFCKSLAKTEGIDGRVVFLEGVSEATKLASLSLADVCVIPSWYEAFGIVALEAQAAGVPVISTDKGGLAHLVRDGETGFHVPSPNPNLLAEKILDVLSRPEERVLMSFNARRFATRFAWKNIIDSLERTYLSVGCS